MAISAYDLYDEVLENNPDLSPIVRGGVERARRAARDDHGRFMPDDLIRQLEWTLDGNHGKAGGRANVKTCKRNNHGKFTRKS